MILVYGWKNLHKDYIITIRVLLPPVTVAPRARAQRFLRITYLDEHGP